MSPLFFCGRIKDFESMGLEMGRGELSWWIYMAYGLDLTDQF